jgi:hypothetical protein
MLSTIMAEQKIGSSPDHVHITSLRWLLHFLKMAEDVWSAVSKPYVLALARIQLLSSAPAGHCYLALTIADQGYKELACNSELIARPSLIL